MADSPLEQQEPYIPDPYEVKRAYVILGGIFFGTAIFVFALIETVMRHGNPFDVMGGGH